MIVEKHSNVGHGEYDVGEMAQHGKHAHSLRSNVNVKVNS